MQYYIDLSTEQFQELKNHESEVVRLSKEKAIEAVSQNLNIPTESIVSFGDDFNDIGMLKLCGKGIAMQNAIDEVKQIANEICLSNEDDGVARWIEENLLAF